MVYVVLETSGEYEDRDTGIRSVHASLEGAIGAANAIIAAERGRAAATASWREDPGQVWYSRARRPGNARVRIEGYEVQAVPPPGGTT